MNRPVPARRPNRPRPPRELPKASSKRRPSTEPRTVATERAQYGHPTVPALDLTAPHPNPQRDAQPAHDEHHPRRRCAVNSNPSPHRDQKAQQRAKSWPEGNPDQTSPAKTTGKCTSSAGTAVSQLAGGPGHDPHATER